MTLKSKEAGRQIQEQSFEFHGRVKKLLFHQPPEWSDDPAMDLGDCFEKVLDFWEEHHQND
jgi:hypothetical protein